MTLEDETGLVEAVVFPGAFRRWGQGFSVDEVARPQGAAQLQDGVVVMRWRWQEPAHLNSARSTEFKVAKGKKTVGYRMEVNRIFPAAHGTAR